MSVAQKFPSGNPGTPHGLLKRLAEQKTQEAVLLAQAKESLLSRIAQDLEFWYAQAKRLAQDDSAFEELLNRLDGVASLEDHERRSLVNAATSHLRMSRDSQVKLVLGVLSKVLADQRHWEAPSRGPMAPVTFIVKGDVTRGKIPRAITAHAKRIEEAEVVEEKENGSAGSEGARRGRNPVRSSPVSRRLPQLEP